MDPVAMGSFFKQAIFSKQAISLNIICSFLHTILNIIFKFNLFIILSASD
jgi:hypothetical protein